MINNKAREYADQVTGDEIDTSDYLKIYHAYEDGWRASEPDVGVDNYIWIGILIGIFMSIFVYCILYYSKLLP